MSFPTAKQFRRNLRLLCKGPRYQRMLRAGLVIWVAAGVGVLVGDYGFWWRLLSALAISWNLIALFRDLVECWPHRRAFYEIAPKLDELRELYEAAIRNEDAWRGRLYAMNHDRLLKQYNAHVRGYLGYPEDNDNG